MSWFFKRSKPEQVNSAELAPVNGWLNDNGFVVEDVSFSIYRDENLLKSDSTLLVVGFGKLGSDSQGFVVECAGLQIIDAAKINAAAASYHKRLAADSLYGGTRLFHALVSRSLEFSFR